MHYIEEKNTHISFIFPPRNVFLEQHKHVPSETDEELKRTIRYAEQEMAALLYFIPYK